MRAILVGLVVYGFGLSLSGAFAANPPEATTPFADSELAFVLGELGSGSAEVHACVPGVNAICGAVCVHGSCCVTGCAPGQHAVCGCDANGNPDCECVQNRPGP